MSNDCFDLKEIGRRMRIVRNRMHKTQAAMADDLGISLSHYSKLEVGIGGMSHGLIYTFCKTYNVEQAWFVYGKGEEPKYVMQARDMNALIPDEETLSCIIEMVENKDVIRMADNFSSSFKLDHVRAMTMMIRELLKSKEEQRQAKIRESHEAIAEAEAEHLAAEAARQAKTANLDAMGVPELSDNKPEFGGHHRQ